MRKRLPTSLSSRSPLFSICATKTVTEARKGFNVQGALYVIIQSQTYLTDAEVKTLLEIDKCVLAPDSKPKLLTCHQGAAMIEQKRKDARRLLLKMYRHPVLTELERLLVELKIFKPNDRHDAREVSLIYQKANPPVSFSEEPRESVDRGGCCRAAGQPEGS